MDAFSPQRRISAVTEDGRTVDLEIVVEFVEEGDRAAASPTSPPDRIRRGKTLRLLGRGGAAAEVRPAERVSKAPGLPVFLGAGFGHGLDWWLAHCEGPVAVVDVESDVAALTGTAERFAADPRVMWIDSRESGAPDAPAVLAALEAWGAAAGGARLVPVAHPAYLRLRPALYKVLLDSLNAVPAPGRGLPRQPFENQLGTLSGAASCCPSDGGRVVQAAEPKAVARGSGVPDGDSQAGSAARHRTGSGSDVVAGPAAGGFWARARYPKFVGRERRILFFRRDYFLMREVEAAARRGGVELRMLEVPATGRGSAAFVEALLREVVSFRPDFALTINHFGIDREGALQDLLARLELPLASWFVDSPELILHDFARASGAVSPPAPCPAAVPGGGGKGTALVSPWTAIFCWDRGALPSLRARGFRHVAHLPLATDPAVFRPGVRPAPGLAATLASGVCFVGNSWLGKAAEQRRDGHFGPELTEGLEPVLRALRAHRGRRPAEVLQQDFPERYASLVALSDPLRRMRYEQYLTWRATAAYRLDCVCALLPLRPLVVGDAGWREMLPGEPGRDWRMHESVPYRTLPGVYGTAALNFNCTSLQMHTAVNQRAFDVPAAGGFLLSDDPGEMSELFEPGREAAVFGGVDEIAETAARYLRDDAERRRIVEAGRARVLAQHTYDHRLHELCARMRRWFG